MNQGRKRQARIVLAIPLSPTYLLQKRISSLRSKRRRSLGRFSPRGRISSSHIVLCSQGSGSYHSLHEDPITLTLWRDVAFAAVKPHRLKTNQQLTVFFLTSSRCVISFSLSLWKSVYNTTTDSPVARIPYVNGSE